MQDEEINKKIKEAADQYHPAYEDDAWNKMEKLLDEHLPQKKERRRAIYFLPVILLLGVAFLIYHSYNTTSVKTSNLVVSKNNREKNQPVKNDVPATANATPAPGNNTVVVNENKPEPLKLQADTKKDNKHVSNNSTNANLNNKENSIKATAESNSGIESPPNEIIGQEKPSSEKRFSSPATNNDQSLEKSNDDIAKNKEEPAVDNIAKADDSKNIKKDQPKKTRKSFADKFAIGLSVGPDISGVRINDVGKITLNIGGELSYSFSDKLTLRTGFYSSKKIYTAGKDDYYITPGSPGNYNYLQSVNANCKVYEVPLTLSYNFSKVKNHNWFISTGLSSYFMKKEDYVYFYKIPSGYAWNKSWGVENQNKHYFSVMDISAGYQYSINKRFSFRAEPYVKLPLSGIGVGKIKLNSAGILFTVAAKPFK